MNSPGGRSESPSPGGVMQPDDLVRVGRPAPGRLQHPAAVLRQRLHRLGGRVGPPHRHLAGAGVRHMQDLLDQLAGGGVGDPGPDQDLLQAESARGGSEPVRHVAPDPRGQVERRPDEHDHPVLQEPLGGRAVRLEEPHGRQRLRQDPLHQRQPDDPPRGVARRGEVADLGEGEQPLVLGVVVRDPVEQVDVLDRLQPLEAEVLQPPELEALGDHRVHVAVQQLLAAAGPRHRCGR